MMDEQNDITIFQPMDSRKKGFFSLSKEIINELKANKWLTLQLMRRNIKSTHKQSFLGTLWALIFPLLNLITFIFLNDSGIFNTGVSDVPYAIYATLGMTLWQLFNTCIIGATYALIEAGYMITKISFSLKSLIIASIGKSLLTFIIQVCLIIGLCIIFGYTPNIYGMLMIVLFAIPLIFLAIGLGFLLSILNSIAHDVSAILGAILPFIMLITPILYVQPNSGIILALSKYNPLYYMIMFPRDFILFSSTNYWEIYLLCVVGTFIIFWFLLVFFHLSEKRIAEII
jgi:homopolymeric O-antigen transport system permease protein